MECTILTILLHCIIYFFFSSGVEGGAVALTQENFDKYVEKHDIVFLNFYADWCRFSQILAPIFDEASETLAKEYEPGKVLFGKVDSVSEYLGHMNLEILLNGEVFYKKSLATTTANLAQRFKITKYPTLKLIRNGKLMKREYRGQRSLEAITDYVRELLRDPVKELETAEDLEKVDTNKRKVVIYIPEKNSSVYDVFLKVAMDLRDDCQFFIVKGAMAEAAIPPGQKAKIIFNPVKSKLGINDELYYGALLSYDELSAWTTNRCIPLVREITFENAEELTEEGLPFLILFHHPDDTESVKIFTREVQNQLLDDRTLVNFLVADGMKFAHPLHHLGKTHSDLPLIAIDSFRHMYLFPSFDDIHKPGKMKEFVLDLFSGKLHREYHYGPDPVTSDNIISTNPPESTFKKLAPSRNRYTLLRDEL